MLHSRQNSFQSLNCFSGAFLQELSISYAPKLSLSKNSLGYAVMFGRLYLAFSLPSSHLFSPPPTLTQDS